MIYDTGSMTTLLRRYYGTSVLVI